jgi:predicted ABC-type ATPase
MPPLTSIIYLVGGCNGAGKTTFAKTYIEKQTPGLRFHNADLLAQGLSPMRPEALMLKAGRLLLQEIHASIEARESFVLESTLSGRTYVKRLREAREGGYEIELHYLWIGNVEVAIQRVKNRVLRREGHDVPVCDIVRRKERSLDYLLRFYLPLANRWAIYDNEVVWPRMLASSETTDPAELPKILRP